MNEELKKLIAEMQAKIKAETKLKARFTVTTKDLGEGEIEAIVASDSVDRHGEILDIAGLDIKEYLNNPVVLWAHQYDQLPIGKTLSLKKTADGKLIARIKFAIDESEFAHTVYKMYKGGFLNAFSIGFIPKDVGEKNGSVVWTKSVMIEHSGVPVPANAEALQIAKALLLGDKSKELETKGAVADELTAEQKREQKHENMSGFWDMIYAFCDVYFADDTEPEQFNTLLLELVDLMTALANGNEGNAKSLQVKAIDRAEIAKYVIAKAGKVLSAKNREVIENAIAGLQAVVEADNGTEEKGANKDLVSIVKKATSATGDLIAQATEAGAGRSPKKRTILLVRAKKSAQIADKAVEMLIGDLNKQIKLR